MLNLAAMVPEKNLDELTGHTPPVTSETVSLMDSMKLKSKEVSYNGNSYTMVNYDKSKLCTGVYSPSGVFRSVLFKDDGSIASFAPPRFVNTKTFSDDIS